MYSSRIPRFLVSIANGRSSLKSSRSLTASEKQSIFRFAEAMVSARLPSFKNSGEYVLSVVCSKAASTSSMARKWNRSTNQTSKYILPRCHRLPQACSTYSLLTSTRILTFCSWLMTSIWYDLARTGATISSWKSCSKRKSTSSSWLTKATTCDLIFRT